MIKASIRKKLTRTPSQPTSNMHTCYPRYAGGMQFRLAGAKHKTPSEK
jgi:hypothetical protein